MHAKRLLASTLLGACLLSACVVAAPSTAEAAHVGRHSAAPSPLTRADSAQDGASWLAGQLTSGGYIPSPTTPGQADLSATANAVLALASAGARDAAMRALVYLEGQVDNYVAVDGADGPGQLALLILDAHSLGVNPYSFAGTDLVSRLLATERTSGTDAGLFGVQDPTYNGAYRQGLSLAALASVGVVGEGM